MIDVSICGHHAAYLFSLAFMSDLWSDSCEESDNIFQVTVTVVCTKYH